jgi:hypothetical protein
MKLLPYNGLDALTLRLQRQKGRERASPLMIFATTGGRAFSAQERDRTGAFAVIAKLAFRRDSAKRDRFWQTRLRHNHERIESIVCESLVYLPQKRGGSFENGMD